MKQFNLQNGGYGTCAVAYSQSEFLMIGGSGGRKKGKGKGKGSGSGPHGKVDR